VFYEGREHRFIDYGISDILQMIGRAGRQTLDQSAKCLVLCHSPKREYLKKLLHESLPIESHLNHYLHDHLNAEIVTKTIETKPDAVDYLTWTFYYRRIVQNPNYYNLIGVTHRHLSDHLSDLIENTIADLEESKCVMVENDLDLLPMNLGMIASYYYIDYSTVELFASSITAKTRVKGVIDILSSSSEFSRLTIRQGEEKQLHKAGLHVLHPVVRDASNAEQDSKLKASVLLQCHFSRFALTGDIASDQSIVLKESVKLLQALVDVISSQGMLLPALSTIEVSQMVVQGLWTKDSVLLQIPHFSSELVAKLKQQSPSVESVFDVMDLSDNLRDTLLCFTQSQMSDVARFCNAYPNVSVAYDLLNSNNVNSKDSVVINVDLNREFCDEGTPQDLMELGTVVCPRFPSTGKKECWWLIVGDTTTNSLLSIKRVTLAQKSNVSYF
jgi:pre-mRNA-splicing helicase BRR2